MWLKRWHSTGRNKKICIEDVDFKRLMIIYSTALQKAKEILEELKEKVNNKNYMYYSI